MSEKEFVEVKVKLPKKADDWFRETEEDVQRYYQSSLSSVLAADLDCEEFLDVEGQEAQQILEKEVAGLEGEPWKPWDIDPERAKKETITIEVHRYWAELISRMLKERPWLGPSLGQYFLESARETIAKDIRDYIKEAGET